SRLQEWLRSGHIKVDGRTPPARMAVSGGEQVLLTPPQPPDSGAPRAQRMPLKIVHEDAALVVIDKPAGLVVHPGAGQPDRTLMNALLAHAAALAGVPRAGIVHRLDKDTSGLLVVAKTVEAQASLVEQLAERTMRRVYLALVQGDPPASGTIDAPLGRDAKVRTRMAVTHRGKPARTTYRVLERFGRASARLSPPPRWATWRPRPAARAFARSCPPSRAGCSKCTGPAWSMQRVLRAAKRPMPASLDSAAPCAW